LSGEGLGKLVLHTEVETANFRIVQVVGDRTHASTRRRTGQRTTQQRRIGSVRKGRQHCGIGSRDGIERSTIKVQGIEDHIVECQYRSLGEGSFEEGTLPGCEGKSKARLEVVVVR